MQREQGFWAEGFPYEGPKDVPLLLIRGSDTIGTDFPDVAGVDGVSVLWEGRIPTPYPKGETEEKRLSPRFQLLQVGDRRVLSFPAHGWRLDEDPIEACGTQKVFWICMNAGCRWGIGGGTVGSLNNAILPGDAVVTWDVDDFQKGRVVGLPGTEYGFVRFRLMLRMRQAICPSIARHLSAVAKKSKFARVYAYDDEIVHVCTDGPWFETPAQVRRLRLDGGDIVGQSFMDEARIARLLGIHWAGFHYSVNPAEGQKPNLGWRLDETHMECEAQAAWVELTALKTMPLTEDCGCTEYRRAGRPARYLKDLA